MHIVILIYVYLDNSNTWSFSYWFTCVFHFGYVVARVYTTEL